jgi:hypothetical protein
MLSVLANIAMIIEAVVVIVSVVFVWYEIRENTRLTRIANSQKLVELAAPFNLQLIQDREMARLWVTGSTDYPSMDPVDQYRYYSLLAWWLMLHENIYYQHERDVLDDVSYAPWEYDLQDTVRTQHLERLWDRLKPNLQATFAMHIEQLMSRVPTEIPKAQNRVAIE